MPRRGFLGMLSTGVAALGLTVAGRPLAFAAETNAIPSPGDPDDWFKQIKGKHRIVFDVTHPLGGPLPFAWPRVFLMTNEATGTPDNDCGVVVVLRHDAMAYALDDNIWEKYHFGEAFKVTDMNGMPVGKNVFAHPNPGDFKVPGVGEVSLGIKELQDNGVLICVCNVAMTVHSAGMAMKTGQDAGEVRSDWDKGLLPGIQVVPSGVWAVNRAQEHGCTYCFCG